MAMIRLVLHGEHLDSSAERRVVGQCIHPLPEQPARRPVGRSLVGRGLNQRFDIEPPQFIQSVVVDHRIGRDIDRIGPAFDRFPVDFRLLRVVPQLFFQ